MIAFLDTSAFAKLLFVETESRAVHALMAAADGFVGSRLLTVEARGAIVRRVREGGLTAAETATARDSYRLWTERFSFVELDATLAETSGQLVEQHLLRSSDAVQLASALSTQATTPSLVFVTYDARLRAAARAEHLEVFPA